jgi:hypothetical protein
VPALHSGLEIRREGFFSALSRVFGSRYIRVGDASFDNLMSVKGADVEAVRAFLNPERREQIRQFVMSHRGAVIADGAVTWSKRGRMTRAPELLAAVQEMLVIGRALAAPVPEPELEAVPESDARTAETHEDSEQVQSLDIPDVATQEPGVDVAEFCATVFAPGSLSYAATQAFSTRFQGQRVTWSGILESASPYGYDFVFGPGDGVRAVVALHKLNANSLGDGPVRAVIQLPAGAADLQERIGEQLTFAGTLIRVDGLRHEVFLSHGGIGN